MGNHIEEAEAAICAFNIHVTKHDIELILSVKEHKSVL